MSNAKFEVEKFDGTNNFGMWQCKVLDVLIQQDLDITLEAKLDDMSEKNWAKLNCQACGTIKLCLAKDQKNFVMKKTSTKELWDKVENKYMSKNVENRLYLKKKLFRFQYKVRPWVSIWIVSIKFWLIYKIWILKLMMKIRFFCY